VSEVTRGSQRQPSLYDVLQVSPEADPAVIRAVYQALSRAYDSAANSPPSAGRLMREVKAAYDVLSDPDRRAQYDAERPRSAQVGRSERTVSTRANPRLDGDPNPPIEDRSVAAPPPGRRSRPVEAVQVPSPGHCMGTRPTSAAAFIIIVALSVALMFTFWVIYEALDERATPPASRGGWTPSTICVSWGSHPKCPPWDVAPRWPGPPGSGG
jgi:hypothetical protein